MFSLEVGEHVRDKQKAFFNFYKENSLWYKTEECLLFEIPISDVGNGTLKDEERVISLVKWIKKGLEKTKKGME